MRNSHNLDFVFAKAELSENYVELLVHEGWANNPNALDLTNFFELICDELVGPTGHFRFAFTRIR